MDRIEECKQEYAKWLKRLGITKISDINNAVNNNVHELINVSEAWHEQKVSEIALSIKNNQKKVILISGPSSSGKTTFARKLQLHLRVLGIKALPISLDNYYIRKEEMPKNEEGEPDFESPESINYRRFNENLSELINGKEAIIPRFDFESSQVIEDAMHLKLNPHEIIIVEGIHGLNPMLSETVDNDKKYRIYCSALSAINTDSGDRIPSRINRMIRRLIRDNYFRNSDYSVTFSLWPNQETGSQKYIFPFTDSADVIFNSSLPYELCVYREHLIKMLSIAPQDDKNIETINYLRDLVTSFLPISSDDVPRTSLVREFIGGGTLN